MWLELKQGYNSLKKLKEFGVKKMPRRVLQGIVVSDKCDKTVTVRVEKNIMHLVYKKYIKRHAKYAAHDPLNDYKTGENVRIVESSPFSRTKKWVVEPKNQTAAVN
jgi:small subunit ribosomal protein S17